MKSSIKYVIAAFGFTALFSSCIKNDVVELGEKGTPFISFQEAPQRVQYISSFEGDRFIDIFTLIRDEVRNSDVTQTYTITITENADKLEAFNEAYETNYEPIDASSYEVVQNDAVQSLGGGQYKITFASRVTNVPFTLKINSDTWDFAGTFALYFTITDPNGKKIKSGKDEIMTAISVKNKYDGVYTLSGYHNRDPYTFPYEVEMQLRTISPTEVEFFWPETGTTGHPIGVGPDNDYSWYGVAISPALEFDLDTDEVIRAWNIVPGTDIRLYTSADGDEYLSNKYNEASKTLEVSWMYGNNPERGFFDKLVYKKSRE